MHEQFVQEGERLRFLVRAEIGGILFEDIQIGAQAFPVFLAAGRFEDVAKLTVAAQVVHQAQVVLNRKQYQLVDRLVRIHQRDVFLGRRRERPAG